MDRPTRGRQDVTFNRNPTYKEVEPFLSSPDLLKNESSKHILKYHHETSNKTLSEYSGTILHTSEELSSSNLCLLTKIGHGLLSYIVTVESIRFVSTPLCRKGKIPSNT